MVEITKSIFLSYASQDAEPARRLCDALRAAGLEVWFDERELRSGDAWDASIRRQIRECTLFLPIISSHTDARSEGYFRREWNLAVDRMLDMSDNQTFLVPVLIDATPEPSARVPDRFRERQWTRLLGGEAPVAFVERLRRLLSGGAADTFVADQQGTRLARRAGARYACGGGVACARRPGRCRTAAGQDDHPVGCRFPETSCGTARARQL